MNEVSKLIQESMEKLVREIYGIPEPIENVSTTSSQPITVLTSEHLVEILDRLNILYDRERGDIPDKRFILVNGDYHGLVNKVMKQGQHLVFYTATGEFKDNIEGLKLFIIDLPKLKEIAKVEESSQSVRWEFYNPDPNMWTWPLP